MDLDGGPAQTLHNDDVVFIQPGEVSSGNGKAAKGKAAAENEVWLGKVEAIRARVEDGAKSATEIFVKIRWLYTLQQLKTVSYPHLWVSTLPSRSIAVSFELSTSPSSGTCSLR